MFGCHTDVDLEADACVRYRYDTLWYNMIRYDTMFCYKIVFGLESVNFLWLFWVH